MGVTWSLGQYSIYLDGTLVYSGNGLGKAMPLKANGLFVIGQKLTSTSGTFDESKSFSGNLSQVNIWNYDFLSAADVDIQLISQSCSNAVGNIINWSALRERASEMVVKEQARSCKPLRNSKSYYKSCNYVMLQSKQFRFFSECFAESVFAEKIAFI